MKYRSQYIEYIGLGLMLWFAYVCLGKPFHITIPFFGNWYLMSGGQKIIVGLLSFCGGVYGWILVMFQENPEDESWSWIQIFSGFYALAFVIIIVFSIFSKSDLGALFS
tara:strand:- start:302 stop:628 length:327 start_codon:yes stop_codon:yes gene_type:complete